MRTAHCSLKTFVVINFFYVYGPNERGRHDPFPPRRAVLYVQNLRTTCQRWSPRGQGRPRGLILKSLPLASKSQVLENCPVLGSRTALCFEQLKFRWKTPETSRKVCKHLFVFLTWSIGVARGVAPPIEISPKTPIVSLVSVSF